MEILRAKYISNIEFHKTGPALSSEGEYSYYMPLVIYSLENGPFSEELYYSLDNVTFDLFPYPYHRETKLFDHLEEALFIENLPLEKFGNKLPNFYMKRLIDMDYQETEKRVKGSLIQGYKAGKSEKQAIEKALKSYPASKSNAELAEEAFNEFNYEFEKSLVERFTKEFLNDNQAVMEQYSQKIKKQEPIDSKQIGDITHNIYSAWEKVGEIRLSSTNFFTEHAIFLKKNFIDNDSDDAILVFQGHTQDIDLWFKMRSFGEVRIVKV